MLSPTALGRDGAANAVPLLSLFRAGDQHREGFPGQCKRVGNAGWLQAPPNCSLRGGSPLTAFGSFSLLLGERPAREQRGIRFRSKRPVSRSMQGPVR